MKTIEVCSSKRRRSAATLYGWLKIGIWRSGSEWVFPTSLPLTYIFYIFRVFENFHNFFCVMVIFFSIFTLITSFSLLSSYFKLTRWRFCLHWPLHALTCHWLSKFKMCQGMPCFISISKYLGSRLRSLHLNIIWWPCGH